MTSPRIALVVPAFNAARFLPALFAGVAAQTRPFDEVIVCDDVSTDDTVAVAEALGARVVRRTVNGGCSAAKNSGLAEVTCDWVHFHDADDWIEPGFVAAAHDTLRDDIVDAWLPGWRHVDAASGEVLATSALDGSALRDDAVAFHLRHTVNNVGVYRVSRVRAAGGFDCEGDVLYNEDRAFHLRLALAGATFAHDPTVLMTTVRHAGSMSQANQLRCLRSHAAITLRYLETHPDRHAQACASACWQAAQGLASYGDFPLAHALVRRAARLGYREDPGANARFRLACRVNPHLALRMREYAVRWFRPWLRRGAGGT